MKGTEIGPQTRMEGRHDERRPSPSRPHWSPATSATTALDAAMFDSNRERACERLVGVGVNRRGRVAGGTGRVRRGGGPHGSRERFRPHR